MNRATLVLAILILLHTSIPCPAQDGETGVWRDFIDWYKTSPVPVMPDTAFRTYGDKLKADGLSDSTIKERIDLLQSTASKHSRELTAVHFDRIYADQNPPFLLAPSAYLVRQIQGRTPGRALDVGMGQGRNSLYLASMGWNVTGYDISEGGMAAAKSEAAKHGWVLKTVQAGHEDFEFGTAIWDLVVMTYSAAPMDDPRFLLRVRDSLKPGGLVIVEQFNAPPDRPTNLGPANALFKSLETLRVIHYEDVVARSEWGNMLCRIGRITAQKD